MSKLRKFPCSTCHAPLQAVAKHEGQSLPCPRCGKRVVAPVAAKSKISEEEIVAILEAGENSDKHSGQASYDGANNVPSSRQFPVQTTGTWSCLAEISRESNMQAAPSLFSKVNKTTPTADEQMKGYAAILGVLMAVVYGFLLAAMLFSRSEHIGGTAALVPALVIASVGFVLGSCTAALRNRLMLGLSGVFLLFIALRNVLWIISCIVQTGRGPFTGGTGFAMLITVTIGRLGFAALDHARTKRGHIRRSEN